MTDIISWSRGLILRMQEPALHILENQQEYREEKVQRVRLIRYELVTDPEQDQSRQIRLETDTELKVLTVDAWGLLSEEENELCFEGLCFTFPTPFHRGDLLINRVTEMRDSYCGGRLFWSK